MSFPWGAYSRWQDPPEMNWEIKLETSIPKDEHSTCYQPECSEEATKRFLVGKYRDRGEEIDVCDYHSDEDTVYEIHSEMGKP